MNLDSIKSLLDMENLPQLPDPSALMAHLETVVRVLVAAGPVVMIILGLLYIFAAPGEANHHFGYRCYFGMGSEQAWRFTQRFAGIVWTVLGAAMSVAVTVVVRQFARQDTLEMLTAAAKCVLWEALVLVVATVLIRTVVAIRYDRHGERRGRK